MSKRSKAVNSGNTAVASKQAARSLSIIGGAGIQTSRDFASGMSALMSDLVESLIAPGTANAICNAGGKLLKVKELELRYGKRSPGGTKVLMLASSEE